MYLGDYVEGATVRFNYNTTNGLGASENPSIDGSVWVYKNSATGTEVQTGVTLDNAFDGLAGVQNVIIDLSDVFYEIGADYHVILKAAIIDGQVINRALAEFSIENRLMTVLKNHLTDIKGTTFVKDTHSLPQCISSSGDKAVPVIG